MQFKKPWLQYFLVASGLLLQVDTSFAQSPSQLTACASETPPFVLMKDGVGSSGFSVDYFNNVAKRMGRVGVIRDLPWARCLREVEAGKVDVAVDAYEDAERRKKFLYTNAYFSLSPQVFYRPQLADKGFPAKSAAELAAYSGCGVHEYTYEHYGLDSRRMDLGAKTDRQMFLMLLAGRCDYAVEELEYIIGGRATDKDWPDDSSLQSYRPSWAKAPQLHYLIGLKRADGQKLQEAMNGAIAAMEKSGDAKLLRTTYFANVAAKRKGP